ncbi:pyruvate dehydrogenase kinase isoform 2; PDK2 [Ectocarpus siliculosus]|uniref:Protein-serine/threonine kinase n=1 Tax=Ectocarpus siliculosus TaxID=2880 RepID=D7G281_ECTSI|nr:pyruvate dehydrogenase kinase isoform 2; PDK2 [Ectocarpus siliculosus]|eukprot:CBJ48758.1 pyruvate dehydrogenase kinase isoform 2; PDK2 [Ectocarpus siliculosus]
MIERMAPSALGGSSSSRRAPQRLLRAIETYTARHPVRATLRGLVHHGRHARSKFVSHHLRDQLCVRLSHQMRRLELFPRPAGASTHYLDQLFRVHADTFQELRDAGSVVERMLSHGTREDSLRQQRCDPLDDFRRTVDAVNNRHAPNVGDVDARASCIPSHVHHILFEVLKNALKATTTAHASVANTLPPVRVRIAQGKRQVSVCVSDEGGGMAMDTARDAFKYLWTSSETYDEVQAKHAANASFQPAIDPLSGMGIGLPVSRLYARHFGGDLRMLSLQGHGCAFHAGRP